MDRVRILERAGNQGCEAVYDSETQYQDVELGLPAMPCNARVRCRKQIQNHHTNGHTREVTLLYMVYTSRKNRVLGCLLRFGTRQDTAKSLQRQDKRLRYMCYLGTRKVRLLSNSWYRNLIIWRTMMETNMTFGAGDLLATFLVSSSKRIEMFN